MKIATFDNGDTKTTRSESATHAWRIIRKSDAKVLKVSQSKSYDNAVKSSHLAIDDCHALDTDDLFIDTYTARGQNRRATMKQVREAREENARRRELRANLVIIEIVEFSDQQTRDAGYRQKWQDIYDNDMQDLY
jgi:hypothetical protein